MFKVIIRIMLRFSKREIILHQVCSKTPIIETKIEGTILMLIK